MKSRWTLSLIFSLMLYLPLQGMASGLMPCSPLLSGQSSEPHDAAKPPCHEVVSGAHEWGSTDTNTYQGSCAGCDMHCTAWALPVTFKLASGLPISSPRSVHHDPARDGVVLDALMRPPISVLL
jgi:hypothetical protein